MENFLGQLALFPWSNIPKGWVPCKGQLLQVNQFQALFSLLGTTFGGDGRTTFGLPDLQGRTPIGSNNSFPLGNRGGEEFHQLTGNEVAAHTHQAQGTDSGGNSASPTGCALGKPGDGTQIYTTTTTPLVQMNSTSVEPYGKGQPHNNMMPYLALNWIIALQGIYPSRS
jgi:microcystin-dependent protein